MRRHIKTHLDNVLYLSSFESVLNTQPESQESESESPELMIIAQHLQGTSAPPH